ncbi:MAG: type II and III secretion system protein [Candidatus Moduliflexus flocculans]|nr:type II and III secretion system protein [Candidatus Moduliflexus flocculans]
MVIGGLIGDTLSVGDYRVPLLGDIPILGYLFKIASAGQGEDQSLYLLHPAHHRHR